MPVKKARRAVRRISPEKMARLSAPPLTFYTLPLADDRFGGELKWLNETDDDFLSGALAESRHLPGIIWSVKRHDDDRHYLYIDGRQVTEHGFTFKGMAQEHAERVENAMRQDFMHLLIMQEWFCGDEPEPDDGS